MDQDDEKFYRSVTQEMTGNVKELALVLINFRKEFTRKIRPHIEDIANVLSPRPLTSWKALLRPQSRQPTLSWTT